MTPPDPTPVADPTPTPAPTRPWPATRRDDVVDTLHGVAVPDPGVSDLAPLEVPLTEQFRVSAIAFGWDPGPQQMLFELHAQMVSSKSSASERKRCRF